VCYTRFIVSAFHPPETTETLKRCHPCFDFTTPGSAATSPARKRTESVFRAFSPGGKICIFDSQVKQTQKLSLFVSHFVLKCLVNQKGGKLWTFCSL
jgi:hypothetical protein